MAASLIERPVPVPRSKVPVRVQVARVFALARLLTIASGILGLAIYAVIETCERQIHSDIWLDQHLLDWRLWTVIFCFWLAVFTASRRYLRLHIRP